MLEQFDAFQHFPGHAAQLRGLHTAVSGDAGQLAAKGSPKTTHSPADTLVNHLDNISHYQSAPMLSTVRPCLSVFAYASSAGKRPVTRPRPHAASARC